MKKIIFVFIAFVSLQLSAQSSAKSKAVELFKANGKASHYTDLFLENGGASETDAKIAAVLEDIAGVYAMYLNEQDLQTMIDFYKTEVGQRVANGLSRTDEEAVAAYGEFSRTEAMSKFLKNAKNIGVKEAEIRDAWIASLK